MKPLTRTLLLALAIPSLAFAADTGDYDGGGGGTLPANPASIQQVTDFVRQNAKRDLRLFLKYEQWSYSNSRTYKPNERLFKGPRTILTLLDELNIDLRTDRPCFDKSGIEVDASIYSDQPNSICFSAFRTAPKVMRETLRKEVLALLLHEFTHLLGYNEADARAYQSDVAYSLERTHYDSAEEFIDGYFYEFQKAERSFMGLESQFDQVDILTISNNLSDLNSLFPTSSGVATEKHFAIFDGDQLDYLRSAGIQLMLANWFAMGLTENGDASYWRSQYEKAFGGKDEITVGEFNQNLYHSEVLHPEVKLRRLHNRADLKRFVSEFGNIIWAMRSYLTTLSHGIIPTQSPGFPQISPNPWAGFRGGYSASSNDCEGVTAIGILEKENTLFLRIETGRGYSEEQLTDGAGDFLGGATVSISGDENTARRTALLGDLWGERWFKNSWEIQKSESGISLKKVNLSQQRRGAEKPTVNRSECNYSLKKVPSVN